MTGADVRARFERYVEHHVLHGGALPIDGLCADRPDLVPAVAALVERYLRLARELDGAPASAGPIDAALPPFDGYRTIERIGGGGAGPLASGACRDAPRDRWARSTAPGTPGRDGARWDGPPSRPAPQ